METTFVGIVQDHYNSAVFEESGEARTGVVIRNYKGEVKASLLEKNVEAILSGNC